MYHQKLQLSFHYYFFGTILTIILSLLATTDSIRVTIANKDQLAHL
jgi:hypothetical protein